MVYLHILREKSLLIPEGATFSVKHLQQNFLLLVQAAMVKNSIYFIFQLAVSITITDKTTTTFAFEHERPAATLSTNLLINS
jgi:hypothetical protein